MITIIGLQFGQVLAGAVLVETVYAWPGLGRLAYGSILRRDSPTLLGILLGSAAMLFEGGLSFLGLGDPNVISWGMLIGQNRSYLLDAWWTVTFPGLALFVTVLSVALVGDGINDAFDPRRSGQ